MGRSLLEQQMDDVLIHRAACRLAVRCRHVIQACLRDEEVADCDREFCDIAEAVIRELLNERGR